MDRKRRKIITFIITIVVILLCVIIIIASIAIKNRLESEIGNSTNPKDDQTTNTERPDDKPQAPDNNIITEAKFIDLQSTVEQWINTLGRNEKAGVMIYDLNNSRTAASWNADTVFNVASLYKLLFIYDGYKQIAIGADSPDTFIVNTPEKGNLNLSQCLDLMMRESYNPCADIISEDPNRISRVNSLIQKLDMQQTSNIGLESTAADITKLLRHYWRHTNLNQNLWQQLTDSMLNQPITYDASGKAYDWRQGLPAGFNDQVNVYNKVGWEWNGSSWNIYADAAIVDFTEFQHYYTIVVLTNDISDAQKITRLGQMIEDTVITQSEGIIK